MVVTMMFYSTTAERRDETNDGFMAESVRWRTSSVPSNLPHLADAGRQQDAAVSERRRCAKAGCVRCWRGYQHVSVGKMYNEVIIYNESETFHFIQGTTGEVTG